MPPHAHAPCLLCRHLCSVEAVGESRGAGLPASPGGPPRRCHPSCHRPACACACTIPPAASARGACAFFCMPGSMDAAPTGCAAAAASSSSGNGSSSSGRLAAAPAGSAGTAALAATAATGGAAGAVIRAIAAPANCFPRAPHPWRLPATGHSFPADAALVVAAATHPPAPSGGRPAAASTTARRLLPHLPHQHLLRHAATTLPHASRQGEGDGSAGCLAPWAPTHPSCCRAAPAAVAASALAPAPITPELAGLPQLGVGAGPATAAVLPQPEQTWWRQLVGNQLVGTHMRARQALARAPALAASTTSMEAAYHPPQPSLSAFTRCLFT